MDSDASDVWHGISVLTFYIAPLALLAAAYPGRLHTPKEVLLVGPMGIALPLCEILLLVGMIVVATPASPFNTPSLAPNIAMALWKRLRRVRCPDA